MDNRPLLVTLDLEGVLLPEIWQAVAAATGVDELRRTTRDEPDYDKLMHERLAILRARKIMLPQLQNIVAAIKPLPGAADFLAWLRPQAQVIFLSDTYYEFVQPLLARLGWPAIFCHTLTAAADGGITGYRLRAPDSKGAAVLAFRGLGFQTAAIGDSFNDVTMLRGADAGLFFRPPAEIAAQFPAFPVCHTYPELQQHLAALLPPATPA